MKEGVFQRTLRFLLLIFLAISFNRFLEYSYFSDSESYPFKHFVKYEIVQFIFACILTAPFLILKKSYRVYKILLIPFWIYVALEFLHLIMFHGFPNSASYFSVFNTNANESVEFISDYFGFGMFLYLLVFIGGLFALGFFLKNLLKQHESFAKISYFSLVGAGILFYAYSSYSNRLHPINLRDVGLIKTISNYSTYKAEKEKFEEIANREIKFEQLQRTSNHDEAETHVIVIGESTSMHHMSLYDYARKTNPLLSEQEFVIFDHAQSPNAHTVPALEKVLTFKNKNNPNLGIENGSIIDLANQAGYETYWISNQAFSGEHETPISVIASKANHKAYTNATGTTQALDEVLFAPFNQALNSPKSKVIFVHLMGTHLSYKQRYSEDFDVFKDAYNLADMQWNETQQTFINQYDNAVLYNDYVVNELLTSLQKLEGINSFTYFSDHGDEVYDFRNFHGHSDVLLSKYMYDIPLLFWFSDAYKLKNSEQMTMSIYSGKGIFNIENLIHVWSDILDVYTEYYQAALSPLTFEYESKGDIIALPIIQAATKNNLNFSHKTWCHRVDGKARLQEAKVHFSGFEIDVVFQKEGWFDVNHPPAESIHLHLKELIKSTGNPSKYSYWLDMKNLDSQNSSKAAHHLLTISQEMNCTENIIVESGCFECLPYFDSLGFKTAYYLPFLHKMNEQELAVSITQIGKDLSTFSPSVLSQERDGYVLVKKHFPNCDIISWDLQTEVTDANIFSQSKTWVSSEEHLKVLLVRFDSDGWR